MDLAIRVNVRYAAPANSQIKDVLQLFKSPRWVHSIIRYIIPQLNSVSPAAMDLMETLKAQPMDSQKKLRIDVDYRVDNDVARGSFK
ncbi:hypothetical protein BBJ29_000053 [Phytophthora kernoviae]|uniref:Uncharacterized protein n=1 Tax=Phytophthora kernoviae TaxID=325452 RepID=A0A3F2S3Y5_9STRA|nr:hypothetical protein BBJ29_000053 [Phytophthora kernoviae]RLN69014.1 hypothetical protein BBP00_00000672 [Phytophthora kernoviae]